jgi:hypothetical protein
MLSRSDFVFQALQVCHGPLSLSASASATVPVPVPVSGLVTSRSHRHGPPGGRRGPTRSLSSLFSIMIIEVEIKVSFKLLGHRGHGRSHYKRRAISVGPSRVGVAGHGCRPAALPELSTARVPVEWPGSGLPVRSDCQAASGTIVAGSPCCPGGLWKGVNGAISEQARSESTAQVDSGTPCYCHGKISEGLRDSGHEIL